MTTAFIYEFLGKLQQDCEYYLGNGNRNPIHLFYGIEYLHIDKMKEIYASIPDEEKPRWCTAYQINNYESRMIKH